MKWLSLELCHHMWAETTSGIINLLDSIQTGAICDVGCLFYYSCLHKLFSNEVASIFSLSSAPVRQIFNTNLP